MSIEDQVSAHYTTATLLERVLAAVAEAGGDPDALTPGDLKAVDEFHTGGLQATDALLEQLEIDETTRVLDIGCGIGGTARHIRISYNTPVTGFDLTPDFVATADALTRRIGLEGITFLTGSALDMPVETGSFDLATMFHVGMNIEDKATLMQEAWRVLAPGGTFALFDVMKVGEGAIPYPVPWAEDAGFSFVAPPETYRAAAGTAGFETGAERARGDFALAFFERVFATIAEQGVAPVGIHLLMRETAGQKIENYVAAVTAGTIAPVEMISANPNRRPALADLRSEFVGIKSPNPFWLASAPPTDKKYNVERAFEAGWGGVVWKTLGEAGPPIVNVNGPRYGAVWGADRRLLGLNNIELITDRPLEVNLREIKEVKRDWPDRAVVVSLMVPCEEEPWKAILKAVEETEADGVELNFGCPHGMSERGMGSAVGQVPDYIEMVTRWCKQHTRMPVIVKLTPNITDIRYPARAAHAGGADAVSLINTVQSITSVNLDTFSPEPMIDGKGSHGGYCGPAVKPIALNMVGQIARDPEVGDLPISAIGGVTTWRDAAEFITMGAGNVQVCTAAMTYGFRIVQEMITGLSQWMDEKAHAEISAFQGRAVPNFTEWQHLNLNYVTKARIDQDLCIKCGRCFAACEDTSHQAITMSADRVFEVQDDECVACNLCVNVCPVEACITMERMSAGTVDPRTGVTVSDDHADWTTHPNNPAALAAE